jgi:hypothetical protein
MPTFKNNRNINIALNKQPEKNEHLMFLYPNIKKADKTKPVIPDKTAPFSDEDRKFKNPDKPKYSVLAQPKSESKSNIGSNSEKHKPQKKPVSNIDKIKPDSTGNDTGKVESEKSTVREQVPEEKGNGLKYNVNMKDLLANWSKGIDQSKLFGNGVGSSGAYGELEFMDTQKHPCWGNYPKKLQWIVQQRVSIPNHLYFTKARSVLRFRLMKNGNIEDLHLYDSSGNKQFDSITYDAIGTSDFPPYDCPDKSVNVQYTFYLNYEPEEIERSKNRESN